MYFGKICTCWLFIVFCIAWVVIYFIPLSGVYWGIEDAFILLSFFFLLLFKKGMVYLPFANDVKIT